MTALLDRVAGAPITWGVDGSPGWGHLMERDRILDEMRSIGLRATELGPEDYLPADPGELTNLLDSFGLGMVGGFVPAVLHRPDQAEEQLACVERATATLAGGGASVAVLAAASELPGYDTSIELDDGDWSVLVDNVKRAADIIGQKGLAAALHPHWGTAVERRRHVERILEDTEVGLCIDTGHLALAGMDPVEAAGVAPERVRHVHLKDLDEGLGDRVRSGRLPFREAVIAGLFRPLGEGSVDVAGVIGTLETAGYRGWYVLEQDCSLPGPPPPGTGPVEAAARSVDYIRRLDLEQGGGS